MTQVPHRCLHRPLLPAPPTPLASGFHVLGPRASHDFFFHPKRDFLEIHVRGRWEYNNVTFFTLNFKMPTSILKFKFPIGLALASPESAVSGHGVRPCALPLPLRGA